MDLALASSERAGERADEQELRRPPDEFSRALLAGSSLARAS